MGVRKRHNKWWVDFSYDGVRYRRASPENTRAGASAYELVMKQRLAHGEPVDGLITKQKFTFKDYTAEWLETYVKSNNKHSEYQNKESTLNVHLLPFFGKTRLGDIRALDVERYKAKKLDGGLHPKTINNHLAILRKSLQCAVEWELIASFPHMKKLKVPPQKFDFLSIDETRQLIDATEGVWKNMVIVAVGTGLRFGELIALTWDDVDMQRRELVIRKSFVRGVLGSPKSNKIRTLPISESVYQALKDISAKEGYVFHNRSDEPLNKHTSLRKLHSFCKKAGLRDVGWHCLRHTFASHLAQAGANLVAVQNLLGHSEIRTTMRYAHITGDLLREAIGVLDAEWNDKSKRSVTIASQTKL